MVDLFDTSGYDLDADDYISSAGPGKNKAVVQNFFVRPYQSREDIYKKHINATDGLVQKVEEFQPDLIALTSTESTWLMAIHLLQAVKKYRVPVLAGGVFCTFAPQMAINFPEIDMICVGEGENAIVDLCELMSAGKDFSNVTNLWVKNAMGAVTKNGLTRPIDVNDVPCPDLEIFDEERFYRPMYGKVYRMLPIETHRGCPYTCSFCNSPSQNILYADQTGGQFFRKRSLDRVYDDLRYFRDVLKGEYLYFWADTFFAYSNREFDAFCEMYADIRLPFWCQTRPETVTEEKIKRLKDVGLHLIAFGLEHGDEKFRAEVVDRRYSNDVAIKALQVPKAMGVPFTVNNVIGFPDETRELAMNTVEINRAIQPDQMSCSIFQPYNGVPLRKTAVEKGYLKPDVICPANSDDTKMDMACFTSEEMKGLRRTFAMYVRFPKNRWKEIGIAEQLTPEGDRMWEKLSEEFQQTYLESTGTDIREQGNM